MVVVVVGGGGGGGGGGGVCGVVFLHIYHRSTVIITISLLPGTPCQNGDRLR